MRAIPFPFTPVLGATGLRQDLDRLFDEVFSMAPQQPTGNGQRLVPVAADAREDGTGWTLDVSLPGVAPEAIEVVAENGVLEIRGTIPSRELSDGERTLFSERPTGRFLRRFRLPKTADLEQVQASHAHGVLTVRVAKLPPAQPRRIEIRPAHAAEAASVAPVAPVAAVADTAGETPTR
jgi:HSP20 family protein